MILEFSTLMKSATISDLILFNALLILAIWELESFINCNLFLLFIVIMICFLESLFVVMFNQGLDLSSPRMIFWMFLIFLLWRFGNVSLIFKISLVILAEDEVVKEEMTWAKDFFWSFLEILLISLEDFTGIRRESNKIDASLLLFSLLLVL